MSMDKKSAAPSPAAPPPAAPSPDADIIAPDAAIIRGGINTATISTSRKTEDLLDALKNSRGRLQVLKTEYVNAVKSDGGVQKGPSSKRRMAYHEIMRTFGAMETLKNELAQRGATYDVDVNDHEHPNAAFKRITAPKKKPDPFEAVFWWYIILSALIVVWFLLSN
jgi:hypothetical protein